MIRKVKGGYKVYSESGKPLSKTSPSGILQKQEITTNIAILRHEITCLD